MPRIFLKCDSFRISELMKVISSKSDFALNSAIKQLEGGVSKYLEEIRQEILHNLGFIEAALDDPEHYDLDGYGDELAKIIVGKPNAGKSSLMNLLLDEERAIVTDIAGTTRDVLEEKVKLGDIILNLVDTAGIHDTDDIAHGCTPTESRQTRTTYPPPRKNDKSGAKRPNIPNSTFQIPNSIIPLSTLLKISLAKSEKKCYDR